MVGVNRYQVADDAEVELLDIDNRKVRESQVQRIAEVRAQRDDTECRTALEDLRKAASREGTGLVPPALQAARRRATVGEISDAMEEVFGRHRAVSPTVSGVYAGAYEGDATFRRPAGKGARVRRAGRTPPQDTGSQARSGRAWTAALA